MTRAFASLLAGRRLGRADDTGEIITDEALGAVGRRDAALPLVGTARCRSSGRDADGRRDGTLTIVGTRCWRGSKCRTTGKIPIRGSA
jgi:hypothetical protein